MKLLDASQVAELFSVSPKHIYRLAREGLLPCVRVGRRIRFDKEKIDRWVADGGAGYAPNGKLRHHKIIL